MRLVSITATFKSLLGSRIVFSSKHPLTCLVGQNGAGKSNILQALGFAAACLRGNFEAYLDDRAWQLEQLPAREFPISDWFAYMHSTGTTIRFEVDCLSDTGDALRWFLMFHSHGELPPTEAFFVNGNEVFSLEKNNIRYNENETKVVFTYRGSILSTLNDDFFSSTPVILDFKRFIVNIYTFDVLEPERLKAPSTFGTNIGRGGSTLASFYFSLSESTKRIIISQMQSIYTWLHSIQVVVHENGTKELNFEEIYSEKIRNVRAMYANDGTLRLLAILAELHSSNSVIIFDEIENGFNPAVSKQLMEILRSSPKQVIISTHSPDLLQYIPDDEAEDIVKLVYRTEEGVTQCMNFFDLPEAQKRLGVLGVGETFLDVDIADAVAKWQANSGKDKEGQ